jgi:hypothetical protein
MTINDAHIFYETHGDGIYGQIDPIAIRTLIIVGDQDTATVPEGRALGVHTGVWRGIETRLQRRYRAKELF